jgi:isopenicillin N synthase-like dioxygenase
MIIYTPPQPPTSIPVLDVSQSFSGDSEARRRLAREIHRACRETGFFYVSGHGVPADLISNQFSWTRRFFDLPLDTKLALDMKDSPSRCGYQPIKVQRLDSRDANAAAAPSDLNESYFCGVELPDTDPCAQRGWRSFGHNRWPANLPGFRQQILDYQAAVRSLGDHILKLIALSLDLPEDWFCPFHDMPVTNLRIIKYPPQPQSAQFNQIGAGAHTDWGGITLLAQDNSGGLEVRNAAGDWIAATPVPATFIVNIGDLMARWTNGVYNSTMHRVKNKKAGVERYSLAFFYSPRPDAVIEAIPTCITAEFPRRFATCTAEEHRNEMFRRAYGYAPAA